MSSERQLTDALREFARTTVTNVTIQDILDDLVRRAVGLLPITAAGVTHISPGPRPRYLAASCDTALRCEQLQMELGEGPGLTAYATGQAVAVPDLRADGRFPGFGPRTLEAGFVAVFTLPLRHGDAGLGALDLYCAAPGRLDRQEMSAAQTLADVAAAYLLNACARADLEEAAASSLERSLHDELTGLPNRTLLMARLEHALLRGRRSGRMAAVLFVDLDRFKLVNDTHGHRVGDELLVAVARRLTGQLRPGDTLARLAGDEFVILCDEIALGSEVDAIAARIAAVLDEPFILSSGAMSTGASVGIAYAGRADTLPEDVLHNADVAMYKAKRRRRRRVA